MDQGVGWGEDGWIDEWVMDERLAGWAGEGRRRGMGPQGEV